MIMRTLVSAFVWPLNRTLLKTQSGERARSKVRYRFLKGRPQSFIDADARPLPGVTPEAFRYRRRSGLEAVRHRLTTFLRNGDRPRESRPPLLLPDRLLKCAI